VQIITGRSMKLSHTDSIIINYDVARYYAEALGKQRFGAGIPDEAHYLKSWAEPSQRAKAFYGAGGALAGCDFIWPMSGTIAPNDISELYVHIRCLLGAKVMERAGIPIEYGDFVKMFCLTINTPYGLKIVGNTAEIARLRDFMRPYILRRTLETPAVLAEIKASRPFIDVYPVPGDALLSAMYPTGMTAEELLDNPDAQQATFRRLSGIAKARYAAELIADELENNPTQRRIVFAYHREVIAHMQSALAPRFGAVAIHGGVSAKTKQLMLDHFNTGRARVLVGQLQACGTAIDLPCDFVDFVEMSWRPDENEQALFRVVNIFKGAPVSARFFSLAGSIDEPMTWTLARKIRALTEFFQGE
jgi:SNF2 family DNA or RNA helicase